MPIPLEINIRDIKNTQAIDAKIHKKADKLYRLYDRITFCRVTVESVQRNHHQGNDFQVNIVLHVPGEVLIVNNQSHRNEDLYVAIRDSFHAMESQLKEHVAKIRGQTKNHQPHQLGTVVRLYPDYGFIATADGNEYYFHETNLIQLAFSELAIGKTVRFIENSTGEGLQAHQVTTT
jgi:ribosomal subunit interface protein